MEEKNNGAFPHINPPGEIDGLHANRDERTRAARVAALEQREAFLRQREPDARMSPDVRAQIDLHGGFGFALGQTGYAQGGERRFTRTEVLISLRAILASKGGLAEAILAFENME